MNRFFDKIYCVTVHDFHDRHELVKTQLQGVEFEWVLSPPAELLGVDSVLSKSEISLILGHLTCVWNAQIRGYQKIAIWEDDGVLTATDAEMNDFFEALPLNWDCLYMGNASWDDMTNVRTTPLSECVNKIFWGTGSSFNGIQQQAYDWFIKKALQFKVPVDFVYYDIFGRGNSYAPAKKFFSDPISTPNEHCNPNLKSPDGFLPSRIIHGA